MQECKAFQWSLIHTSQELIKAVQSCSLKGTAQANQIILTERAIMKENYAELKELQRWWVLEGKNAAKQQLLEKKTST